MLLAVAARLDKIKPHNRPDLGSLVAPRSDPNCGTPSDPNCGIIVLLAVFDPNWAAQPLPLASLTALTERALCGGWGICPSNRGDKGWRLKFRSGPGLAGSARRWI
jgi:hypothetical protein